MDITVQDLETAINHWRERRPSEGSELSLSPEVSVLAEPYARMIFEKRAAIPLESLDPRAQQLVRTALGLT